MVKKIGLVILCTAVLAVFSRTTVKAETQPSAPQRQAEEKAAEKKLTELDKKMGELSSEPTKTGGSTKDEMNRLYEDFKKQQGAARGNLENLRKATNESWEKAKKDMDKALENLNGLYERSKAKAGETGKDTAK